MLGLPSTTEVGRRLPKERFYCNLKLDAKTRDEFVHRIDRITVANTIKPTTANVADGKSAHEIMVLDVALKGMTLPLRAVEAIAKANPHKLVFVLGRESVALWRGAVFTSQMPDKLAIVGETVDEAWDSFCAQLVFGNADGHDIDVRLERKRHREALEAEVAKLDAAAHRERQTNRKNKLFTQMQQKKRELAAYGKDE